MKRLMLLLLAVVVIFAGCGEQKTAKKKASQPTIGWYESNSPVEQATNGSIRVYQVRNGAVKNLMMVGNNVVLIDGSTPVKVSVMEPGEGRILAQIELPKDATGLQEVNNALVYFRISTKEAIYLNESLQTVDTLKLPDEVEGAPIFAPDSSEIFYCSGQDIKSFDIETGVVRPVRSHSCKTQQLTGVYFNNQILSCDLTYEDGTETSVFVSAKTGALIAKNEALYMARSNENRYIGLRQDGTIRQVVFGMIDDTVSNLEVPQDVRVALCNDASGVATYTNDGVVSQLAYYNIDTGSMTDFLELGDLGVAQKLYANKTEMWVLAKLNDAQMLYSWTFDSTSTEEAVSCVTPVYTAENPNADGLKVCEKRATTIANTYYVDIRIWDDAVYGTDEFEIVPEHQVGAIDHMLTELETVLSRYPDHFLYKSANNLLRICVVRSVDGELKGAYFRGRTDPYILLSVGCNVAEEFDKAMGYVINSRVLGKSPMLDTWNSLNPEGFEYGKTVDEKYLTGDKCAFADKDAMQSVTDDRSILFMYAMQPGNEDLFKAPIMQSKLKQLCLGIRDAWRWEDDKNVFPWEQYLAEPLAPQA